jgi:hypothetical protein
VVKNREQFNLTLIFIAVIQDTATISIICNLTVFQKGTHYFRIKVFNNLASSIKNLAHDTKQFRFAVKGFLLLNSFYSLEEYFNFNTD